MPKIFRVSGDFTEKFKVGQSGKTFFTRKILVSRVFYYKTSKACLASKRLTTSRVDGRQSHFAVF